MTNRHSRREFMQLSSAGIALAGTAAAAPSGKISVWVTAGSKRFEPAPSLTWQAAGKTTETTIRLDRGRSYQEILGFGAAFTDAACYMFNQLAPAAREQLFHDLFDPGALGLSVCRTCMGASDYATKVYSYDDGEADPELSRFSIEHDREYILPAIRLARKINPRLFLLASPWSPPGWMKAGNSMLGGSMRRKYLPPYANYFVKFLQAYAAEGAAVDAVTSQNEVDTDQDGRMPACLWGQEYEIEFVGQHLGPQLKKNGLDTKIWLLDHNYSLWGRAVCELEDTEVNRYADGIAWHGYTGQAGAMSRVHEAFPAKHAYWTEGGPDYTDPAYQTDWAKWSGVFAEVLRNWSRCVIGWNLALDEQGRPNIGPFPCGGLVTIHSQTKEITRSGQYWAFAHYGRAIRRGARRIDSAGTAGEVRHVAAQNSDGSIGMVLTNPGAATTARVVLEGKMAEVALPGDSVTTLEWR